ncbi:Superoxide dismutase [Fe] 3 chloroplastic [Zea mays]|uniref:Superoxide dismutase [Fe] 3 chloroplastic n=1 Tax=Zea mays TaxID=4577 RepID=A0A1D6J4T5_MAIZE|nr:Superoxide dismutase [Fe] 3 chloroplastic [Zea mays]AQK42969.1 Superoxide dismutase [Fe] 3 chloroplastic [Zea mays]
MPFVLNPVGPSTTPPSFSTPSRCIPVRFDFARGEATPTVVAAPCAPTQNPVRCPPWRFTATGQSDTYGAVWDVSAVSCGVPEACRAAYLF